MAQKKKPAKSICQKIHFKNRMKERYSLEINRFDIRDIITEIRSGDGKFLHKITNRLSIFQVMVKGVAVNVVYDRLRGVPVTALTREMLVATIKKSYTHRDDNENTSNEDFYDTFD